ncbi:flavin reductase family protein [Acrocarpospora catenulata]|uniref:flavin reductase family protein n=1 Tax=Acrocarpospora catenulata TaxID=2836182 RepID=UPI001BDAC4F5|nr:flavin reductase family protein [Acrocarpospora catenulata]
MTTPAHKGGGLSAASTLELDAIESVDERGLRTAFSCFPSGVTALCALGEDGPDGMAASAFTPVSLEPPLVSVCVQKSSRTWPRLRPRTRLGVSVLAATQETACRSLSRKSGDRFDGVAWTAERSGAVVITGAAAWMSCVIDREIEAGDHYIVLLRILGLRWDPSVPPLVFHSSRFRSLSALADPR